MAIRFPRPPDPSIFEVREGLPIPTIAEILHWHECRLNEERVLDLHDRTLGSDQLQVNEHPLRRRHELIELSRGAAVREERADEVEINLHQLGYLVGLDQGARHARAHIELEVVPEAKDAIATPSAMR